MLTELFTNDIGLTILIIFFAFLGLFILNNIPVVHNFKEFAVGSKKNNLRPLIYSLTSLCIGHIILISFFYDDFLYIIISIFCCIILFSIYHRMIYWLFPLNMISIIDPIRQIYSARIKIVFIFIGIVFCVCNVVMYFSLVFILFREDIVWPSIYCGIAVFATVTNGVDGLLKFSVPQLFIFTISLIVLCSFMFDDSYTWELAIFFDEEFGQNIASDNKISVNNYVFIFLYFFLSFFNPAIYQCVCLSKDTIELKDSLCLMLMLLLGLLVVVLLFFLLKEKQEAQYYLFNLLTDTTYSFKRTAVIIAVMSIIFINIVLNLNSSSVLICNDLYKIINLDMSRRSQEFLARLFCLILGASSSAIARLKPDLHYILSISYSVYIPVVFFPIFLTRIGFRTSDESMMFGIYTTLVCVLIFNTALNINMAALGMVIFAASLFFYIKFFQQTYEWVVVRVITDKNYDTNQ
ncbi:MAG: hypothetical protein DGJ47_000079 [Rickettsiaceae bacterium]